MNILTSIEDGILTIEFDRPGKKNALTAIMYDAMANAFDSAQDDPAVRVILIQGKRDFFTAGNDLEDFLHSPPKDSDSPVFRFLWHISRAQKPVVAAVAGAAVGIGTTLLLHCDLVYAADTARFSMPFTQLGLCPEAASSLLLPRLAGYQRAAERLLLGEPFSAEEAHDMGLVNRVLPVDSLHEHARGQASRLAALPVQSLHTTKALMKQGDITEVEKRMNEEAQHFRAMLEGPAAREAFTAFLEKRKPDFSKTGS
jgi:enoyl-CoA hydratase/carnithine racemase